MSTYLWWRDHLPRPRPYSVRRENRTEGVASYLTGLSDDTCIEKYRLDKEGVLYFTEKIKSIHGLKRSTKAGLSVEGRLLIALRYFATGNSISSLKDSHNGFLNLSHGSVYNCILDVSAALASLGNEFLVFPTDDEKIIDIKHKFYQYGGFPGVMGAIDGTVMKIRPPSTNEEAYVGRKEGHFINCQVVCDLDQRFLDAVVRWPGSTHDSTIWEHSGVKRKIEDYIVQKGSNYKGWFIGDSGYAQRETMMVPLSNPQTDQEKRYYEAHKKCRCSVERTIGVLKSRFRCLCRKTGGGIQYHEKTACNIIVSCMVLYNYCRSRNMDFPVDQEVAEMIEKENKMKIVRKSSENTTDTVSLRLGQLARASVVKSF